jgi:hypothetical protein
VFDQEVDNAADVYLLSIREAGEPLSKLVGPFNLPGHQPKYAMGRISHQELYSGPRYPLLLAILSRSQGGIQDVVSLKFVLNETEADGAGMPVAGRVADQADSETFTVRYEGPEQTSRVVAFDEPVEHACLVQGRCAKEMVSELLAAVDDGPHPRQRPHFGSTTPARGPS